MLILITFMALHSAVNFNTSVAGFLHHKTGKMSTNYIDQPKFEKNLILKLLIGEYFNQEN